MRKQGPEDPPPHTAPQVRGDSAHDYKARAPGLHAKGQRSGVPGAVSLYRLSFLKSSIRAIIFLNYFLKWSYLQFAWVFNSGDPGLDGLKFKKAAPGGDQKHWIPEGNGQEGLPASIPS